MYLDCSIVAASSVDLLSMDDRSNSCPRYEFINLPYNGYAREGPFTADGLGTDAPTLALCDGKLGIEDFSYARVSLLNNSSVNRSMYYLN
jgi:hypothetical protein